MRPGRTVSLVVLVAVVTSAAASANAANIAGEGTGIIGLHTAIDSTLGTPYAHAGSAANVNDAAPNTTVDTWNENGTQPYSYVGVLFPSARTDVVRSVTLNTAAFFDGGWFGPNGTGPGASGTLTADYLTAPTVQVTFDRGTTWVDAPAMDNYVVALEGTTLPAAFGPPTAANPATFTLTTPVTGINGIRLIGSEGGTASGGFIGVFNLSVDAVPEPTSVALLTAGGLLVLRRRRA
jgi:hypothetical protein